MKKYVVYAYVEEHVVVDDYVIYSLNKLKERAELIIFVTSVPINDDGTAKIKDICDSIILSNSNNDDLFSLYSQGIAAVHKACAVNSYDLILTNSSVFGPVYDLNHMLSDMNTKDCDFWSVSQRPFVTVKKEGSNVIKELEMVPDPYFYYFKGKVLNSECFVNFWKKEYGISNKTACIANYDSVHGNEESSAADEITDNNSNSLFCSNAKSHKDCALENQLINQEKLLLNTLVNAGFKFDSFVKADDYPKVDSAICYCYENLVLSKSPFVKQDIFTCDYEEHFDETEGNKVRRTLCVLSDLGYDNSLIYKHILKKSKLSCIRQNLQLNYVFSEYASSKAALDNFNKHKVALILYVYYESAIDECLEYAFNLPSSSDLIFVYSKDDVYKSALNKGLENHFKNVKYVKKINKGRDLTSYLIDCKDVFEKYDYVCFFHDKKSPQLGSSLKTRGFFEHCMDSLLQSKDYVYNLIEKFDSDPNLGMLVAPPLNYGDFYTSEFYFNPDNKKLLSELIEKLDLNVPFDDYPVAPFGDMFWIRAKAMRKLYNVNWTYDDIPDEPLAVDGTILHALERVIPFVVQAEGYYTAWSSSHNTAQTLMANYYYIEKTLNQELFARHIFCRHNELVEFTKGIKSNFVMNMKFRKLKLSYRSHMRRRMILLFKKKRKYQALNILTFGLVGKFRHAIKGINDKIEKY